MSEDVISILMDEIVTTLNEETQSFIRRWKRRFARWKQRQLRWRRRKRMWEWLSEGVSGSTGESYRLYG
ncbi:MAG TPA: hypothetical protein ENF41_02340 [Candidatus Bathyarchaeota archaeon]|nr:hypothetical protein [Candidatus Bathyarchaeota archaeon]